MKPSHPVSFVRKYGNERIQTNSFTTIARALYVDIILG